MRRTRPHRRGAAVVLLAGLLLATTACASGGEAPTAAAEPDPAVPARHLTLDLTDRSRPAEDPIGVRSAPVRHLPTELHLPAGRGRVPLVVFAHGYDGDPGKFDGLLRAWSDAGFAVLAPRFPITATGAAAGPIARAGDVAEQPADMSFVLDRLLAGPHGRRIDRDRIGVAGLSLGGGTTWGLVVDECCRDRRLRAAIVMDGNQFGFGADPGERNRVPLLVMHADADYALPYAAARESYDRAAPPKYLVTIHEAVHAQPYEDTPDPADEMVERTTIDFWRAYLRGDRDARGQIVADATVAGLSDVESDTGSGSGGEG